MLAMGHEDKGYLVRSSATSWSQKDGDETDTLLREASLAIRRTGRPLVCDREGRYARCIMTIPEEPPRRQLGSLDRKLMSAPGTLIRVLRGPLCRP